MELHEIEKNVKQLPELRESVGYLLKTVAEMQNKLSSHATKVAYNVKEASTALGVEPCTIRQWVRSGKLKASSGKPMLIPVSSIESLLKNK